MAAAGSSKRRVKMDREGARGRHRGQSRQAGQKCAGWGGGENEWARPGSTGSAALVPESLAGRHRPAESPAPMLREARGVTRKHRAIS